MNLTQAMLDRYLGGQFEVQNPERGTLYRGEINSIVIIGSMPIAELQIEFRWMAKGVGYPPLPSSWVASSNLSYHLELMFAQAMQHTDERLVIQAPMAGDLGVLFPLDGSQLDPSRVDGLDAAGNLTGIPADYEPDHTTAVAKYHGD